MRRTTKKIISLLMAVAMVFSMSGMTAMATGTEDDYGFSSLSETYDGSSSGIEAAEDYVSTDKLDFVDEVQVEVVRDEASSEADTDIQDSVEEADAGLSADPEAEYVPEDASVENQENAGSTEFVGGVKKLMK